AEQDALLERAQADRRAVVLESAARLQDAHQGVEQGRLAGAVRADHGDYLAGAGGDRQAVQDLGSAVAGVQVVDVEQELGHGAYDSACAARGAAPGPGPAPPVTFICWPK